MELRQDIELRNPDVAVVFEYRPTAGEFCPGLLRDLFPENPQK
jgi:hypothetical protein